MIGGDVAMTIQGLVAGAGSLVKVSTGRLTFLEIYVCGDEPWPDDPHVMSFGASHALPIRAQAT